MVDEPLQKEVRIMKKVFRIWKFVEYCQNHNIDAAMSLRLNWPFELEGKTKEEIAYTEFLCTDERMVMEGK